MGERALIYTYSRGRKKPVYIGDDSGFFLKATENILGIGNYSDKVRKYRSRYSDEERGREEYEVEGEMEIIYDVIKYTGKDLPELVETAENIRRKTASMLREQKLKQSKIPWSHISYIFSVSIGMGAANVALHFGAGVYSFFIFWAAEELTRYGLELARYMFRGRMRECKQMVNELKKILEEENIPLEIHKFKVTSDYHLYPYEHEILLKLKIKNENRNIREK